MAKAVAKKRKKAAKVKRFGNTALFAKVKAAILAHPEKYDQSTFCGTAMCFAGHAVAQAGLPIVLNEKPLSWARAAKLDGYDRDSVRVRLKGKDVQFEEAAQHLLSLTDGQSTLFYSEESFPETFQEAYKAAKTDLDRARVGVARIEFFELTGK